MKVTVLGATGDTGEELVRQALDLGYDVTAVARRPVAVALSDSKLRVVQADPLDSSALRAAIADSDAVLSALGSRKMNRPTSVYSAGVAAALIAMRDVGAQRFIAVSAIPAAPDDEKDALSRFVVHPLLHQLFGGGYSDMRRMEALLRVSDLDWTVFRPPYLTNVARTGRSRMAVAKRLPRAFMVSRSDLAAAMIKAIQDHTLFRKFVTIAN